jgi:hypothetical protein
LPRADLIQIYIATKTASSMGAPVETAALQAEAEQAVAEAVAKIDAMRRNGDLKQLNARYKIYRRTLMERGQMALPYSAFLEHRVATIVRNAAMSGRAI